MTSTRTHPLLELARAAELEDDALGLLDPDQGPRVCIERLADGGMYLEAIRFLAHALPPRSAVWWGWGCAVQAAGDPAPTEMKACIEATRAWIAEPTDERRHAAGAAAEAVEDTHAASLAALAAFVSGGSMAPPGLPEVPAPPLVCAKLAAGAICFAAQVEDDPVATQERLELYLKQGMEVARKSGVWPGDGAGSR